MYTDEDLESAVEQGVFSRDAVNRFRGMMAERRASPAVDEENFRLLSGFNDMVDYIERFRNPRMRSRPALQDNRF